MNFDGTDNLSSFHPEMAFFRNLSVNPRSRLCGVHAYASAQLLDFLDLAKNCACLNWKLTCARISFMDGHYLRCNPSFQLIKKPIVMVIF